MVRRGRSARTRPQRPQWSVRGRTAHEGKDNDPPREPHWIIRDVVIVVVLGLLFTWIQLLLDDRRSDREQRMENLRVVREYSLTDRIEVPTKPFMGLDLQGMNLPLLDLSWSIFDGSDLSHASLVAANMQTTSFRNVTAGQADFSRSWMWQSKLVSFRAEKADFTGAVLVNATLDKANLTGATMARANLEAAFFKNADLTNVLGLDSANLRGICYDAATKWPQGFSPPPSAVPVNPSFCRLPEEMAPPAPEILLD